MPKSNGNRPVNKTDGGKKRAKKQMTKSRRVDSKKKTLVEQVLSERNLTGFVKPEDSAPSTAPVYKETQLGRIRIEGEVTPQKIKLAEDFDRMFHGVVGEIMDLAAFVPNPATLALVKKLNPSDIADMKSAQPWTIFPIDGIDFMKTPDNKLDTVKNYCYRLEKAVVNVAQAKQADIDSLKVKITKLEEANTLLHRGIEQLTQKNLQSLQRLQELSFPGVASMLNSVALQAKQIFSMIKSFITNLLSD